ncbi:hypothetical protein C0J52_13306 [Blattella germanica]|nr:hypothetical protein C0J52_13306 [Blattella germanica]
MSKKMPVKRKYFDGLPDEIVIEIFSYLNLEDLAYSVPRVSKHWRELSQDYTIWKDKVFRPEDGMDDEQTIQLLKHMPALKSFSGLYWPGRNIDSIIDAICTSCNELESFHLTGGSKLPYCLLEKLTKKCLQLKRLSIPILKESDSLERSRLISKLQSLTHLEFSDRYAKVSDVALILIADGCPSLKYMDLGDNTFHDNHIRYFLQKKQKQLVAFKVWCPISPLTFNSLLECLNLEELLFNAFRHFSSISSVDLLSLQKFKMLKKLEMRFYHDPLSTAVGLLFAGCALSRIVNLTLCLLGGFNERHFKQVILNCPRLTTLCIELPKLDLEEAFKIIGNCRNLRSLGLGGYNHVTAKCLDYVAEGCPNLSCLNLACSQETPNDVMLSVLKMKRLEVLHISYSGGKGCSMASPMASSLLLRREMGKMQPHTQHLI